MKKKYRIKKTSEWTTGIGGNVISPVFIIQVRAWWGLWVNVKAFYEPYDPDYAKREAEELLENLPNIDCVFHLAAQTSVSQSRNITAQCAIIAQKWGNSQSVST